MSRYTIPTPKIVNPTPDQQRQVIAARIARQIAVVDAAIDASDLGMASPVGQSSVLIVRSTSVPGTYTVATDDLPVALRYTADGLIRVYGVDYVSA